VARLDEIVRTSISLKKKKLWGSWVCGSNGRCLPIGAEFNSQYQKKKKKSEKLLGNQERVEHHPHTLLPKILSFGL
jgi:hypothetical protein